MNIKVLYDDFVRVSAAGKTYTIYGNGSFIIEDCLGNQVEIDHDSTLIYSPEYHIDDKLVLTTRTRNVLGTNGVISIGLLRDAVVSGDIFKFSGMGKKSTLETLLAASFALGKITVPEGKFKLVSVLDYQTIMKNLDMFDHFKIDRNEFFKACNLPYTF
jgi:hypothetical protein|tara:strand:+ start:797 stop:1273 length:477 start_codon:yes stop_codon:yes gene_type:complete